MCQAILQFRPPDLSCIFKCSSKTAPLQFQVIQFLGDGRQSHSLFCQSEASNGEKRISRAQIERIHKGKRAANDVCAWSGHLAECEIFGKRFEFGKINHIVYV
jgi:hypothetical protein